MSDEPARLGNRLLDFCLTILLAAMVLWGAVAVLRAIWAWLCVGLAVMGVLALSGWIIWRRFRRW